MKNNLLYVIIIIIFFPDANMTKSCTESIKLLDLPNLNQIQHLPETNNNNNNTTDSDLVVQLHLLNNNSQNAASPLVEILEKENDLNVIVNPIKVKQLHNHSQKEDDFSTVELNTSNGMNITNYVHTVQAPVNIDDEDDLKTTQAIVSLAMNIAKQQDIDFKYTDGFEDENTTDLNVLNTSNEIQTNCLHVQQDGDQTSSLLTQKNGEHITLPLLEDEYQITNSLKILESLVNIEHSKLKEQRSPAEKQSSLPNVESKKNKDKKKSINISKKQTNDKSKKQVHITAVTQEWKAWNVKNHKNKKRLKNKSKEVQVQQKNRNKKSKSDNNLGNSSQINSLCRSGNIQNDQNVLLDVVSSSNSHKNSTITKVKSLNTNCLVGMSSESQIVKNNSPANKLKTHLGDVENIKVKKKGKNTNRDSNTLKTSSLVASTSSCNKKDKKIKKNKSINSSDSVMVKTYDYKQLYEIDRKSLFNPDVIITLKSTKASVNVRNENSSTAVKSNDLSNETEEIKLGIDVETEKASLKHNYCSTKKNNDKQLHLDKNTTFGTSINVLKRLRVDNPDNEMNNNSKKYKTPDITEIVENQESNNVGDSIELKTVCEIKEELVTNYEVKDELVTYSLDTYSTLPDWLKQKYVEYNLKPVFVVIERSMIFD